MDTVCYAVDSHDRVISIGGKWATFARVNDAPHLAEGVLGRSLWEFIDGGVTRQVYRDLLVRVRQGVVVRFPFRCDSPTETRDLTMTMQPAGGGDVEFTTHTAAVAARVSHPGGPVPDLIRVCSWCKRVWGDGAWCQPEYVIERLELFSHPEARLTHGICDRCEEMLGVPSPRPQHHS